MKGYVGTYASKCENGIYQFSFDSLTKAFEDCHLYSHDQDAKYLSMYEDVLAYPSALSDAAVKVIQQGMHMQAGNEAHVSCYIIQDAEYIYTANYHDGVVKRYKKYPTRIMECDSIYIQELAGTHQVILYDDVIFVPCRLLDCVNVYDRLSLKLRSVIRFPEGSGPRHGILCNHTQRLYIVSENTCELFCIQLDHGYQIEKVLPLLPLLQQAGGAAIRLSKDERFLYVSIRECNLLCVICVETWQVVQYIGSGGDHPRDIALDPSQRFLFVANRFSDNIVAFERNEADGCLHQVAQLNGVIEGVSIVFEGGQ